MKIRLLLFLITLLFIECKPKAQKSSNESSQSSGKETLPTDPMAYQIKLTVTYTTRYCGGAQPTDEMMAATHIAHLKPDYALYIRAGKFNDINQKYIKEVKTDSNGVAYIRLPKGSFTIVGEQKKDKKTYDEYLKKFYHTNDVYTAVDTVCYKDFIRTPDIQINLTSDTSISYNFVVPCSYNYFPCVTYIGQLPK